MLHKAMDGSFVDEPAAADAANRAVLEWEARRGGVLRWFEENQFGIAPIGRPAGQQIGERGISFADGKIRMPVSAVLPDGACAENPAPVFLLCNPGGICGQEALESGEAIGISSGAITRRGYALVLWGMNSVAPNVAYGSADFGRWAEGAIAWQATGDAMGRGIRRNGTDWGTIAAWAWGCSRVMDWIETRPELDAGRVAVIGHSRGGKTALWAGAQDGRFRMAVSNNSGCGGAKMNAHHAPGSEQIGDILERFPNWFCPNFARWAGQDAKITHDADDLLRLIAPRFCCIGSAQEDAWAGPEAERAAFECARGLWRAYGNADGINYHLRSGGHGLLAEDWAAYLDFADRHMCGKGG